MATKSKTPWGGRFSKAPAERVRAYTESISFDSRLAKHDIRGSLAHAAMLRKIGLLSAAELQAIRSGFEAIRKEIESGTFPWNPACEDVHMNLETALTLRTPAGLKLHTGRSRNDQVATATRLWIKDEIASQQEAIRALQRSLVDLAERYRDLLIPGYTHLQRAQPVFLAHHLLAYVEMLDRDFGRYLDCLARANVCPLGSGAIAGSTLPLDREFTAKELGFVDTKGRPLITRNSMDAVSDRDFIVEFLAAASLVAVHLSRLSEDIILWSSAEFGFMRLGDAYTTGSSLMPQKKNPDIAELARGKSGRVIGNLMAMLVTLKGLPMTYNRDLQEDKPRLFDTADTVRETLLILAEMLADPELVMHEKACELAAADPLLLATDLADDLVRQGIPFREAHELVGKAVAIAEQKSIKLDALPEKEWQAISPEIAKSAALLKKSVRHQLQSRETIGAPNPMFVKRELSRWNRLLGQSG